MSKSVLDGLLRRIAPRKGGTSYDYDFECDIKSDGSVVITQARRWRSVEDGETFYSWRENWTADDGQQMSAWIFPKSEIQFEGYPPPLTREEVLAAFKAYLAEGGELEN